MRIFAITQWHHFAYMIISIALLGCGASGTLLSLGHSWFKKKFLCYYRLFSGLFPVTILLSYVLNQQIRFNPFEIVWNPRQIYAGCLLSNPLCAVFVWLRFAWGIGSELLSRTDWLVYGANLLGSGCGV